MASRYPLLAPVFGTRSKALKGFMHREVVFVAMRPTRALGLIMMIAGIALTVLAAIEGDVGLSLFLIIPVFQIGSVIGAVGVLLVFAGIFVLFFLPFFVWDGDEKGNVARTSNRPRQSSAGVVLIGPIPIIWGSDSRMALLAMAVALAVMALMILLLL